jgi:chorismate synthase
MRVVVTGPKAAGKTTVSRLLSEAQGLQWVDVDHVIEELYRERNREEKDCSEIYRTRGKECFRELEREAIEQVADDHWCVISTGGSSLLHPESRRLLRPRSIWVYLDASADFLWERLSTRGIPAFLEDVEDPERAFKERASLIQDVVLPRCDCVVDAEKEKEHLSDTVLQRVTAEMAARTDAANTFGDIIRLTTFGESHGPMVGAVLDGLPPGIPLDAEYIQRQLDRRKPGQSSVSTSRKESDRARIVSGVFEGQTTGTPIGILIKNKDSHSKDYGPLRELFRPGHADFTFWRKYGRRDHRGGGRSSGRETASRVAGGAIARQILRDRGVTIRAYTRQIGDVEAREVCYEEIENNPVRCPDPEAARRMEQTILDARENGDSVGGMVQAEVMGLPAGLGDPIFAKLDARLARAIVSIGAVKGVEFGAGFAVAGMHGSENNDEMRDMEFQSNNAGGVLGGISTGQTLVLRAAIKPTPSVSVHQKTCNTSGENVDLEIEGRHDPCIAPRVVPVVECMIALVLLDAWEIQERINPGWRERE